MTGSAGTWEDAVRWLMTQPDHAQVVRDCYYDLPLERAASRYFESEEWREIHALLPGPGGKALDVGAGNGIASYALARSGYAVTAVEPDPSKLVGRGAIEDLARTTALSIMALAGTGESVPAEPGEFDLVFARQVLHHAQDLPRMCVELFRVLRPGGTLVAARDHVVSSPRDVTAFRASHPLHQLYGGENAYPLHYYRDALVSAGFEIRLVLRSFDSVINYYPHDRGSLRAEIVRRAGRFLGPRLPEAVLRSDLVFDVLLRLLSRIDRRPGRLVTFVCTKPPEGSTRRFAR